MRTHSTLSALLLCTAMPLVVHAGGAPTPSIVTVPVDQAERIAPPTDDFMRQGTINPSTEVLKAQHAPVTSDAEALPPPEAPPAPSYRTLGAAAAAGINPLASTHASRPMPARQPTPGLLQQRWVRYGLVIGALLAVLGAAALVRERFSREADE